LLIVVASLINVRTVFVNISPALIELITFNNGLVLGSLIFVVASILISIFAAVLYVLPGRIQWPIINGFLGILTIGVLVDPFSQILIQTFNLFGMNLGRTVVRLLFRSQSLIPLSALIIFLIIAAVSYFYRTRNKAVRSYYNGLPATRQTTIRWITLVLAILLVLSLPTWLAAF
jgi:hypothetical protein